MFNNLARISTKRFSSTLLVVEQLNGIPLASNLHALTAAQKIGFPITCLVGGENDHAIKAAAAVSKYPGVEKVLVAKSVALGHSLAEGHANLISSVSKSSAYSHIISAHSPYGKNVFPRAAAIMDISPISDVVEIDSSDTFKRPIYAGNAIATVKSSDKIKMLTIRPTAFAPSAAEGGSAKVEDFNFETKGTFSF